jgi:hypothetical protein
MSGRWVGGGAVALVHLLFLLALLMTDRLTQHKVPDVRPMIVYRVPEESMATRMPPSAGSASRITSLPSVTAPRLDGPMIVIRPDKPQSPGFQGLDLSVKPSKTLSLDDLAPPSQEKRLKQFFKETAEANRLANEPPGGMECKSELTSKDGAAVSMGGGYRDPVPIQTVCSPRSSAKELAKRNQRYSPP